MWDKYSEKAKSAVFAAITHSSKTGQSEVGAYQLLYGIASITESGAAKVLQLLGISCAEIVRQIEINSPHFHALENPSIELSMDAQQCIELANSLATELNSELIHTEHLLLAVFDEQRNLGSHILKVMGIKRDSLMEEIKTLHQAQYDEDIAYESTSILKPEQALDLILSDKLKLRGTSLLSISDLNIDQFMGIMSVAAFQHESKKKKELGFSWEYPRSLAMIFEKPSLRTRVTFDLGMRQMGGLTTILGPAEIGLGSRETVPDVTRNLERWVDAVMARVFEHKVLVEMQNAGTIPIINALSDLEHPCQALADFYTMIRLKGKLDGLKLAWVGDGNNVLHSLMLAGALTGMTVSAACPPGYEPDPVIVERARQIAGSNDRILLTSDPLIAAQDADFVYTDVWTSMGQEREMISRVQAFRDYQVNAKVMSQAKPDALFMHCLPAHRGDEVTDEVLDGPHSVVFDQAEARLYAQQAVLALTIGP